MKILFFINTLGGGGAEKLLLDLVCRLESSYNVYVYTLVNKGVYIDKLPQNITYKSLINSNNKYISLFLQYLYVFILPSKLVYKMFFKEKFDVEVAFLEGPTTKIISKSTNKESLKIAWVHYDLYHKFTIRKMYPFMFQHIKCYKRFDNVVCVCNETKENFIKRFGFSKNVVVLNNFIDMKKILAFSKESFSFNTNKIVFTSVGRLVDDKGFSQLLSIYNRLSNKYPNTFEAYIIGDGPNKIQLKEYIDMHKLYNVHIVEFTLNPYKYIKNSDYFISSSLREGFGLVLVEALALDIPVITTKTSGSIEIIKDESYGLICKNFKELELNLEYILNKKKVFNFGKTSQYARYYDINTQLDRVNKLFKGGYHDK